MRKQLRMGIQTKVVVNHVKQQHTKEDVLIVRLILLQNVRTKELAVLVSHVKQQNISWIPVPLVTQYLVILVFPLVICVLP